MFEDGPNDGGVFDAADDAHLAFALRTDQRIDLVYFLYQPRPVPAKGSNIDFRFEDTGNRVVVAVLL